MPDTTDPVVEALRRMGSPVAEDVERALAAVAAGAAPGVSREQILRTVAAVLCANEHIVRSLAGEQAAEAVEETLDALVRPPLRVLADALGCESLAAGRFIVRELADGGVEVVVGQGEFRTRFELSQVASILRAARVAFANVNALRTRSRSGTPEGERP